MLVFVKPSFVKASESLTETVPLGHLESLPKAKALPGIVVKNI
jgi:hypothetical protein